MAVVGDADKLAYQTAYSEVKREIELNLRTFKVFIDLEDNGKVAVARANLKKHQWCRLMQEVASLTLLIRIYYLK
jgi:hypothetical protein